MYLLVKVLCQFYSIPELSKWVPVWEMWPVFRAMILVVLKNDLELTTMLMLIITICTATSTQTTTPGNFLICYACLSAKHFMWIFWCLYLICCTSGSVSVRLSDFWVLVFLLTDLLKSYLKCISSDLENKYHEIVSFLWVTWEKCWVTLREG